MQSISSSSNETTNRVHIEPQQVLTAVGDFRNFLTDHGVSDSDGERIYWHLREAIQSPGEKRLGLAHSCLRWLMDDITDRFKRHPQKLITNRCVINSEAIERLLGLIEKEARRLTEANYSPSDLLKRLSITDTTLARYADAAGVKRPGRGKRNHRYSATDARRIAEAILKANAEQVTKAKAQELLNQLDHPRGNPN